METKPKINKNYNNSNNNFDYLKKSKLYLKDISEINTINIPPLIKGIIKQKKKKLNWLQPNFVEIIEIPSFKKYTYINNSNKPDNCGPCIII